MAIFPIFFFLGNIDEENVFYDIAEWKNPFLGYINKKLKRSNSWHFCKGVNPEFWSKNGNFSNFFFSGNIDQEHVFFDILERKNAFLVYKYKKFKKSKNWHFFKEVNPWFWPKVVLVQKWPFFQLLFLRNWRLGKCLLRYSRTKKCLSRL